MLTAVENQVAVAVERIKVEADLEQARAMELALHCHAAVLSPSTGNIDSRALMLPLLGDAERDCASTPRRWRGASRVLQTRDTRSRGEYEIAAHQFVNVAGLGANARSARLRGLDPSLAPLLHYARGNCFAVPGGPALLRLIYPCRSPGLLAFT